MRIPLSAPWTVEDCAVITFRLKHQGVGDFFCFMPEFCGSDMRDADLMLELMLTNRGIGAWMLPKRVRRAMRAFQGIDVMTVMS